MPSRAAQKLIYTAAAALVVSGVSATGLPGVGAGEPRYMAPDNPWALPSDEQREAEARAATESSVYYRNCDAARAAGAAPIRAGQPGYREGMDGDGDGIACEPYYGR